MPTVRYAAVNAAYWAGFCLILGFSSVFLLGRGLTNTQIGVVLALSGLASAILQPWVAGMAEVSTHPLRHWIAALAGVIGLAGVGLLLPVSPVRDGVIFGLALCLLQVVLPLVNALGMQTSREVTPVDFGIARAIGSLSFAATSVMVGALVARTSIDVLAPLIIVTQALLVIAALTFVLRARPDLLRARAAADLGASQARRAAIGADESPGGESQAERNVAGGTPAEETPGLVGRGRFLVLLIGIVGCFVSHSAINNFGFQIIESHGGTSADLGLALLIAAIVEIVPMLFFSRMVARWTPGTLLRVAAVIFAVKAVATLLAPNLASYLATMILQVGSFGVLLPATVYYVDRMLPVAERTRGQAYMTLTLTVGSVVVGLGGGQLLDRSGVPALLAAGAAASLLAVVLVFVGTSRPGSQSRASVP